MRQAHSNSYVWIQLGGVRRKKNANKANVRTAGQTRVNETK